MKPRYADDRAASLKKLKEAIASLETGPDKGSISLDSIHVRSVALRKPKGERGIAVSTILADPACAALYYAKRTRNPLSKPPEPRPRRDAVGATARSLSRALRKASADNARLRRDIASIGAVRARSDRQRVDGEEPDWEEGQDGDGGAE